MSSNNYLVEFEDGYKMTIHATTYTQALGKAMQFAANRKTRIIRIY